MFWINNLEKEYLMTPRERMLKTLRHGIPDRVPCYPDISIMVPLRLKKRLFWEFYLRIEDSDLSSHLGGNNLYTNNKRLMDAYIDAVKYFGIEGWAWYAGPKIKVKNVEFKEKIVEKRSDRIVTRTTMSTPDGDLWAETVYPIDNPPFPVRKYIKHFEKEFKFLKYFHPSLDIIDFSEFYEQKKRIGDNGVTSAWVMPPSLLDLDRYVDGGLGKIGLIYYDYPDLIKEYKRIQENWAMEYLEKLIEANCVDEIGTGGLGLITWQGPRITRELSLDGLKKITKWCKDHNVISHLHCCGFERALVKMCAEETDLDAIEPLEGFPQGDCDLRKIKEDYGEKLCLKGNLHTSRVMLNSVKTVEAAAIKCIEDAAEGGGYILSTGDQCGRDTPEENIFKLVEAVEEYGRYS